MRMNKSYYSYIEQLENSRNITGETNGSIYIVGARIARP